MSEDIKRLYRSRSDRMIGGVCGGLGDYLNIDPTLVRLAFAILALAAGPGLPLYIIMWIVVPEEPLEKRKRSAPPVTEIEIDTSLEPLEPAAPANGDA